MNRRQQDQMNKRRVSIVIRGFLFWAFCGGEGRRENSPCFPFSNSGIKLKNTNEKQLCARLPARDFWRNAWAGHSPERVHIPGLPASGAFLRVTVPQAVDKVGSFSHPGQGVWLGTGGPQEHVLHPGPEELSLQACALEPQPMSYVYVPGPLTPCPHRPGSCTLGACSPPESLPGSSKHRLLRSLCPGPQALHV